LARAIAGTDAAAVSQRFEMACRIAAAQVDVARVRRARCELLSATPLNETVLARAAALDRYERRALSRRKSAIRQFDAAFPQAKLSKMVPLDVSTINSVKQPNEPDRCKPTDGISAKRTQGAQRMPFWSNEPDAFPFTAARFGRTNPTGTGQLNTLRVVATAPAYPGLTG
jgi:hypothetical protein